MSISDAESIVMEVLWRDGPRSAEDVIAAVGKERRWSAATVKTLLGRLLKKRAIKAVREGRRYIYTAVLSRDDYVAEQSQSLLDRLFGGRVAPLVSQFSAQHKLSAQDVAELKRLIEGLEDGK
jgi:predicted transcriptional regulator